MNRNWIHLLMDQEWNREMETPKITVDFALGGQLRK